jgi:hypothetical protein
LTYFWRILSTEELVELPSFFFHHHTAIHP